MAKLNKAELWRSRIAAMEESGLSAKAWCEQNGVTVNHLYYWKHCLSRADRDATKTEWLPAVICNDALVQRQDSGGCIVVKIAGAEIEVRPGFNTSLLRSVVLALGAEQC